jgi:hypothetical protein
MVTTDKNVYIIPNELDEEYIKLLNKLIKSKQSMFNLNKYYNYYYPLNVKSIGKIQKVLSKAYVLIKEGDDIVHYEMKELIPIDNLVYDFDMKESLREVKSDLTRDFDYVLVLFNKSHLP